MLSIAADTLAAAIVPFFFIVFGLMWLGFAMYDLFTKK
jgi:hypothetical protein